MRQAGKKYKCMFGRVVIATKGGWGEEGEKPIKSNVEGVGTGRVKFWVRKPL